MNILNMCAIPVLVTEVLPDERITRDEYNILTNLEMSKRESEKDFSTHLSKSSQILEIEGLENIKSTKEKYVNYYLRNVLSVSNKFTMTSSWLTMNQNGSAHERHSHGNVILSCVMYFSEDLRQGNMANFYISQKALDDVFRNFQFQYNTISFNEYNSPSLNLPTKNNLLIVFPGWMLHGSEPMKSSSKRYCIGSNYFLNDHVGSGYHSLSIEAKILDNSI